MSGVSRGLNDENYLPALWDDDYIQFTRLLGELNGIELPKTVMADLCESMDVIEIKFVKF